MAAIFAFRCSCCGELHEGSPSIGYKYPDPYLSLTESAKKEIAKVSDDLCVIECETGEDFFVRAILEIPIHGIEEPFLWGIWVSASRSSFTRYVETFNEPIEGDIFFGWVCNEISPYPTGQSRPADVLVQTDGTRPKVVLHREAQADDQLVFDQINGISIERAQQLAEQIWHG